MCRLSRQTPATTHSVACKKNNVRAHVSFARAQTNYRSTYVRRVPGVLGRRMSTFDLFSAVRDGNAEVVHRLLQTRQFRARLNARNEWGDTALHLAAEGGNSEICHMLKAAGASVTVRNNRGETCLHRSSVGGHVEACRTIVGRWARQCVPALFSARLCLYKLALSS